MQQLWWCWRFPCLALEVMPSTQSIQSSQSGSTQQMPLVISESVRGKVLVHQANALAQKKGIEAGMLLSHAYGLHEKLLVCERVPQQEQQALERLAQMGYDFTPKISVRAPQSLLLEVAGSLKLFGDSEQLQQLAGERLTACGVSVVFGWGHTPESALLASMLAAKTSENAFLSDTDFCASGNTPAEPVNKIAMQHQLASLSIHHLPLTAAQLKKLRNIGVRQLRDLYAFTPSSLAQRLGKDWLLYWQKLWGERPDPQVYFQLPDSFARSYDWMEPVHQLDALLLAAQHLLDDLSEYLRLRQKECSQLEWQLKKGTRLQQSLSVYLSQGSMNREVFVRLTELAFRQQVQAPDVDSLQLSVTRLSDYCADARHYWSSAQDRYRQDWLNLLDTLSARLGKNACQLMQVNDAHIPEGVTQWQSPSTLQQAAKNANNKINPGINQQRQTRPHWLLKKPLPLKADAQKVYYQGPLKLLTQPERIQGQWWQAPVLRDYFVASQTTGRRLWIFKELKSRRWFLHGFFA